MPMNVSERTLRRMQFPPQNGEYKVTAKEGDDWRLYVDGAARLQISVGQEYHEGEKFRASCEWAAARFTRTTISVNDTLQRFNLVAAKGFDERTASLVARAEGDRWLDRNKAAVDSLDGAKISRWDDWLGMPDFEKVSAQVEQLYASEPAFKDIIDTKAMAFSAKAANDSHGRLVDSWRSCSTRYALEEVAVSALMAEHEPAIEIYPGSFLKAFEYLRSCKNAATPSGFKNWAWARIGFARQGLKVA